MTTRNLDAFFAPKSIALVGASNQPNSVGAVLALNLFNAGFRGPIFPVNPHEEAIRSTLNFHSVAELPMAPDLAVIATPPQTVPGLVDELGRAGCRAAVVVTAGFGEGEGGAGHDLQARMLNAAEPHLLRIVGPNCLGLISTPAGINASFAHLQPAAGDLAFVTQSGAIATAVLDWAAARGIGFSHVVSLGDMADVDFGDLLDYLALDTATRAILLYVESIRDAQKFMSAGRIAARAKPVIVIKSGRSKAGAAAALSHTGALAGSDFVYDAAFRRAGMLRVFELRELFEAATTLASGMSATGDRLTVLTNGGGAGVLAADALEERGGRLAALSAETVAKLDTVLPKTWSRRNPVDIIGDADGPRYARAMEVLIGSGDNDALLVMNCPTAVVSSFAAAEAVVAAIPGKSRTPVLTCWLGEQAAAEPRRYFAAHRIPTYETPDEAVRAFMHLVDYRRNQDLLLETPAAGERTTPDRAAVRAIIAGALAEKRKVLTEPEAKNVLVAYGIPTVATRIAASPDEAAEAARAIGKAVVLKILSPDITHKSDVGGVHLDLATPAAVAEAATAMLAAVKKHAPAARITGFSVQEMVRRPNALELLLGMSEDRTFGPILLFGQGGTATEVIGDRAVGLPPLNSVLAAEMIRRTRVARLLAGYRDRPPAAVADIVATLMKLSELVIDFPEIGELDINPLLADDAGVLALDARVAVRAADGIGKDRLAIRPYPAGLALEARLRTGERIAIRPIRPEDEPRLIALVAATTPEDLRLRFLGALRELPHAMAARLSQIDYAREMAFVATAIPSDGAILGVARMVADPENEVAEYAILVRSDWKGRGLGYMLMTNLLAYARARGLKRLHGDVLRENATMLQMADELGFRRENTADPEVVRVCIDLAPTV